MTPHRIYIGSLLVGLALAHSIEALAQQRADTLRRNLTVLTSEVVELGERTPEPHRFVLERPAPPTPAQISPAPLPRLTTGLQPDALAGLDSLQPMPQRRVPLGYASASLGLAYSAHLSAGLRPINTDRHALDLHLSGGGSKYQYYHRPTLAQSLSQSALRLGARYQGWGQALRYGLSTSYYTDSNPALGIIEQAVTTESPEGWTQYASAPSVRSRLFRLGGMLSSIERGTLWYYDLRPSLAIASRGAARDIELEVAGTLGYRLEQSSLHLASNLALWNCAPNETKRHTLSLLSLTPSWRIARDEDGWAWHADLGATLALGTRPTGQTGLLLAPSISAGLSYADWVRLSLAVDGGISGRRLSEVIDATPYLRVGSPEALIYTPWRARLAVELLPLANLSVGLHGSLARHRGAEGIAATTSGYALLAHHRYYEDANLWSLGGSLRYRARHYLEASLSATYEHWQTDSGEQYLGGKPSLCLSAALSLTPYERLDFTLGYDLMGGYRYRVLGVQPSPSRINIGAVGQLVASVTYRLAPRLSLLGYAHYVTTPEASRLIGFPTERLRATIGINWIF